MRPGALRWLLAIGLLAAFGWIFATRLDPAALARALGGADYRLVLLCAVGHMVVLHPVKAWRWALMLAPMQRISPWTLYHYNLAGCATTNVLPARSGQAVRVLLVRRHGVPVIGAIAVVVLEEILNTSMLALIALPLPFMLHLGTRTSIVLGLVGVGAFLGLGVAIWLVRSGRGRSGLRQRIVDGLALLSDRRSALLVFAQTAVLWLLDLAQIALLMGAVGIAPGFAGAALVLLFVNLTNAIPVTPGQFGLFEAAATAACVAVGAGPEQGLAVGVLYHVMQFIPETAWGALVLARASLGLRRMRRGSSAMSVRLPVLSGAIAPGEATGRARAAPGGRLTIAEWLRFGPFLAQLVVTRRCNLSCGYCNEYDDHSPPVPFAELDERLLKLRELRTWVVCLTGGEPTLHPDLVRIVERMRELRFRRRQLITNGYLLTPKLIDALNDAGLTDLQISVDGVRRNAVTVKVLDPLRAKLLEVARRARFQVVVSAVIGSAQPEEALEVVRFARAHGLTPRIILLHDGSGRLSLSADELATYREVKRLLGRRGREAADYREDLIDHGRAPFRCRAGSRYLYVDESGKVAWCSQTRGAFERDLAAYSLDDLREQFHTRKTCSEGCTVGCVRTASAYDGWRAQAG